MFDGSLTYPFEMSEELNPLTQMLTESAYLYITYVDRGVIKMSKLCGTLRFPKCFVHAYDMNTDPTTGDGS